MAGTPRNSLTPEAFLRAALDVARRSEVRDVSLRSLARELGVSHMALYRHFADREALIDAMIDHVMGTVHAPPLDRESWESWIEEVGLSMVRALDDYPGLADEVLGRVPNRLTPNGIALTDRCVEALEASGLDRQLAGTAFLTLWAYILGAVQLRRRLDKPQDAPDPLPATIHATFDDEHFRIGLRLLVHGVSTRAPHHRS